MKAPSMHIQKPYWEKLSKFSQLSFCQAIFLLNQTPSCIFSMCLHCIGKVSNDSIKSCGRSWSAHEGTVYAYTKALLGKIVQVLTAVIMSKIIFSKSNSTMRMFNVSTLYWQSIKSFHQKLWQTLIGPWRHHLCIYISLIRGKLSKFSQLSFCEKLFFSETNSFMHMFNVSTLYRQSIKFLHQKLW